MRFALTAEQNDFAASLRKIGESAKTPGVVRAWGAGDSAAGKALIGQLAEAGALGLTITEDNGGFGAGPVELIVAFTEIGRAAVPGPLVETAAAIPALLQALPDSALAAARLPELAEGAKLGTLGLATASAVSAGSAASGTVLALDADIADLVLLAEGDRLSVAVVDEQVTSIDAARRLFAVHQGDILAEGAGVREAVETAFDTAALAAAAQLLGAGRALLDTSVEYVKQRQQFGTPIGRYQSIKHHLANVLIGLEMAQPLLYRAALTLQDGTDATTRARDVSAAKLAAGEAAYQAARIALQVHGAIGYTAECDLSLWLTKVTALRSAWGTPDLHRSRIAAALRAESGTAA
ncbi:acyl-CoA dehydrogenase family protein [Nocardia sp. 2]|uniref:Acyl-CoA dehydrogenase family protein n=1 Tax=Nocardia acididurans TaxID=2802282 RepID=A0ABS1MA01_9NOCA|nr:acyl-CoA dehydrogenase family protein [Nocardia acididurans]MBL1077463.1 acyl-CoA dehydrogenase family protein [Nocardia acididurans]